MARTALVLGATGLIGSQLLSQLLVEKGYSKITVLTRNKVAIKNDKLIQVVGPLDLAKQTHFFEVDDVYCCLGTTIKKAKTKEEFRKVDYQLPVLAAEIAAKHGVKQFSIISALGANSESSVFYNQVKGEMEKAILQIPFESIFIFRPSLLLGERNEFRFGEKVGEWLSKPIQFLLVGILEKYRPIKAETVAKAMICMCLYSNKMGVNIIESDEIQKITK